MRPRLGVDARLPMATPALPRRRRAEAAPERAARAATSGRTPASVRSARNLRAVASVATLTEPKLQRFTLPRTRRLSVDSVLRKCTFAVATPVGPAPRTRSAIDWQRIVTVRPAYRR